MSKILPLAMVVLPLGAMVATASGRAVRRRRMRAELAPKLKELRAA